MLHVAFQVDCQGFVAPKESHRDMYRDHRHIKHVKCIVKLMDYTGNFACFGTIIKSCIYYIIAGHFAK